MVVRLLIFYLQSIELDGLQGSREKKDTINFGVFILTGLDNSIRVDVPVYLVSLDSLLAAKAVS